MCGIAGFFDFRTEYPEQILRSMTDAIIHRGPDDEGHWLDKEAGVALGHRRLSILDLSPAGHQPMVSFSGRYVIVFNGEIYNHQDLRTKLDSLSASPFTPHASRTLPPNPSPLTPHVNWKGHSDTETLLAGIEAWGIEATLKQAIGMFAFALWDRQERVLALARDRMGEKPLYYGWQGSTFLFGSELKALKMHPSFRGEIDRNALALYLRHNYIPAPYSVYQGIRKLRPGTILTLNMASQVPGSMPDPSVYWSLNQVLSGGTTNAFTGSDHEAVEELEKLLRSSVRQQMEADVPLGAFLSGGVDSSVVVALMQAQSSRPVRTFTIGFNEKKYNEAEHAKAVAKHLGTKHTELYVTPQDALEVIPCLPALYDEPFSDSSQIPTFLVSQMTRQHVTVSLSGDAGDELFGGYGRYFLAQSIWNKISRIPKRIRPVVSSAMKSVPPAGWDAIAACFPASLRLEAFGDRMHKLAEMVTYDTPTALYRQMLSHWKQPTDVVLGATEPATVMNSTPLWPCRPDFYSQMMYLDSMSYLPDDILVKVDRAAMGVSLETRVPLLDHRIVEFAWRLPLRMKIRNGQGKWLLRQVLYRYVPKELIERPKTGFGVPIESWLRGPLRDWAENLLDEKRMKGEGFFRPEPIRLKWDEHITGKRNWSYYLWDVLMFQAWLEAQRP